MTPAIYPLMTVFLPTPSARRATVVVVDEVRFPRISTHALREEGDILAGAPTCSPSAISTHALREEGDQRGDVVLVDVLDISTHALREEGD